MPFASQPVGKLHWVIRVCHNYPDREELLAKVGRASMWSYAVQTNETDNNDVDDDDEIMTLPISMVMLMTTCDI